MQYLVVDREGEMQARGVVDRMRQLFTALDSKKRERVNRRELVMALRGDPHLAEYIAAFRRGNASGGMGSAFERAFNRMDGEEDSEIRITLLEFEQVIASMPNLPPSLCSEVQEKQVEEEDQANGEEGAWYAVDDEPRGESVDLLAAINALKELEDTTGSSTEGQPTEEEVPDENAEEAIDDSSWKEKEPDENAEAVHKPWVAGKIVGRMAVSAQRQTSTADEVAEEDWANFQEGGVVSSTLGTQEEQQGEAARLEEALSVDEAGVEETDNADNGGDAAVDGW